ncbi:uncharacterized protein [Chironomus tepperi]|uniref:uncharacterized protein isoform X2 n=1 Tax=Chironomus tepperi TaxID=113505 RepID=UPI00391FA38D
MAAVQRRIVHKQFNSPIALYSDNNVKETLDRELRQLGNGAIGINFDDPATTRPGSLAKSAVLAALEEDERNKAGSKPGSKRVAWPPPPESSLYSSEPVEYHQEPQQQIQPQYQAISQQQKSQPVQNQQVPSAVENYSTAPSAPPKEPSLPKLPSASNVAMSAPPQRPVSIHGFSSFQQPLSPLPSLQTSFSPQYTQQTSYHGSSPRGWSHVQSPRSPGVVNQQPKLFYQNASIPPPFEVAPPPSSSLSDLGQPQAQLVSQVSTPQQQIYQQPQLPQYHEDTPKQQQQQQQPFAGTPLRKEAPITQKPAPVYQSQPVAATFQGGANMRGDIKWPPTEYKMQAEIENEQRRKLALGPAFRPKRVNKDYSRFFAQNAISNTYPGYRVPPGTLHIGNANQNKL